MEFIGGNFSSKNVNFQSKNLDKKVQEDKKSKEIEAKKVEAKVLDALASYNKAAIHFKGNDKEEYNQRFQKLSNWFQRVYKYDEEYDDEYRSGYAPYLISKINEGNIDFLEKVCFGKDENDNQLFSPRHLICDILFYINEDNFALAKKLCLGRDENGDVLFPMKDIIGDILKVTSKYNVAFAEKLCFGKDENGNELLSDKYIIESILSCTTEDNIALFEKLWMAKDENGKDLFSFKWKVSSIASKITKENIAFAEKLCLGKDENGKDLFPEKYIIDNILQYVTKYNVALAEKLCFDKDENGNDLYSDKHSIVSILSCTTEDNIALFEKLWMAKDENGNDLFPEKTEMSRALRYVTKENFALAEKLCFGKDENGNDLFPQKDKIFHILVRKGIYNFAEKLCFGKDENGNDLFPEKDKLADILSLVYEDNSDFAEKLCFGKDENGNDLFPEKDKIVDILSLVRKGNSNFAEKLCFGKDENGNFLFSQTNELKSILRYANEDNIALAEKLYFGKDKDGKDLFPEKDKISNILRYANEDNIALAEKLCFGKDKDGNDLFPEKDKISNILFLTNKNNIALAEKLYFGKDKDGKDLFPEKDKICNIIRYATQDNFALAEKLCFGKDKDGNDLFSDKDGIATVLLRINKDNSAFINKLCFGKDENGNDLFPQKDKIRYILFFTNKDNIAFVEKLCFGKDENGNDLFPQKDKISGILYYITQDNFALAEKLCLGRDENGEEYFPDKDVISLILKTNAPQQKVERLIELCHSGELSFNFIPVILEDDTEFDYKKYGILKHALGKEELEKLSVSELNLACKMAYLVNKNNINEIDLAHKKEVLKNIISKNIELFSCDDRFKRIFPLLPENQEQYCALVSSLAKSIGIETNEITEEDDEIFDRSLKQLSLSLAEMSDKEFNDLEFHQEYSKEDFMKNVFNLVKDMNPKERQKVYDYFGFELKANRHGSKLRDDVYKRFSIVGYPVNLNNGKKLAQIEDVETRRIVEKLRPEVIRFSENNYVTCSDKTIEKMVNEILEICPEIRTEIGKTQCDTHEFDAFKHSLKVMQKIVQNPEFEKLNDSDKKIMLLASMLHSITKTEGVKDVVHPIESAFDGFYISKKFDLTHDEEIKLYSLIKNHEWLRYVNSNPNEQEERLKSVAYDLQYDNLFDMAKIFTEADLKAVKKDDRFFDEYSEVFEEKSQSVKSYIDELKATQPLLPVTKIPSASRIKQAITRVNPDHSTNLAGIYQDENGMVIIRYNEVENETWEKIGFDKGTISKGVEMVDYKNQNIDTGNIKFFAHGLAEMWELQNFDAFQLPDSDALLSVSYMELPENKYRLFRPQGVLLTTDTKYEHGGGDSDAGSGCKKRINVFKKDYAYEGSRRHENRTYVADLIKKTLAMTDEEYMKFVKANENKAISKIEPKEYQKKLIEAFATINSNKRKWDREYNEMYITNPTVMGVFAYSEMDDIGNTMSFIASQEDFLKQYALDNDIPFVIFGN